MPRSRLGPLAIESKLGDHPSQSSVWRAIHVKQHKSVAVKIFSVPFGGTPEARSDFAGEWERLKKLQHPAMARCYGGGFEENDAFLAFELIEGETLAATLERRERLPWETVLDWFEPIIEAMDYLSDHQLHHGRIQPDKIMISGLSPILLDMRVIRDEGPFQSGRPATVEELAYRAPETFNDLETASVRSDLYSLGAVMYRCLTGRPPVHAETAQQMATAVVQNVPVSPASIVMECPVWLDKLIMQLLEKNPAARPAGTTAVKAALVEVRKRAMSRTGVAEHVSSGFSPLQVTDQKDRDEARVLLGHHLVDLDEKDPTDDSSWHDKPWVLVGALVAILGILAYFVWPLNEDQLRQRAEDLMANNTRSSLIQAKLTYLEPLLQRFPEGKHVAWANEQIDRVEMVEAEHFLSVKLKRNLPLSNEGERLYAEAQRFERFGDVAAALDQYRSIVTLMSDRDEYRPFVNLARRQIAAIEEGGQRGGEAAQIIQAKLSEAEKSYRSGNVIAARSIWYSIVDLYGDNSSVASLVEQAQQRLSSVAK